MSKILVVDDEQPVRDVLAMLFGDAGHHVLIAVHGRQALDLIEQEQPDLIVSDVMMPVLGGVELCRRLKRNVTTNEIPIILMSSAGFHVARDVGADAFIDKPFEIEAMEALVRRWLERRTDG